MILILALTLALLAPSAAQAAVVAIDGSPLNVYADETGRIQARFDGAETGEFYNPFSNQPNAGFHLGVFDWSGLNEHAVFGPYLGGNQFTPLSEPMLAGDGTESSPYVLTSGYSVSGALTIGQTLTYVNGDQHFTASYTVTNNDTSVSYGIRPSVTADLYVTGSDAGRGYFSAGPPREVGGINEDAGLGAIREVSASPWSRHQSSHYSSVFNAAADMNGAGLTNTVDSLFTDNGVGVQWDDYSSTGLPPMGSAGFAVTWRFERLSPDPPPAPAPSSPSLPPPVLGKSVNVKPVRGEVFVSVPAGSTLAKRAHASQKRTVPGVKGRVFVPLRSARQLPVGSMLDTRKGGVRLTSSRGSGRTQTSDFDGGVFQVLQSRRARQKGLTTLSLKGGSFKRRCASRRKKRRKVRRSDAAPLAQTARKRRRRIRKLRGRGRGRFRTRGRYSSATVRGTTWTVTDRCDGTLTKVSRGKVLVRDFRRKKNVKLKRGKSYLAKAP